MDHRLIVAIFPLGSEWQHMPNLTSPICFVFMWPGAKRSIMGRTARRPKGNRLTTDLLTAPCLCRG